MITYPLLGFCWFAFIAYWLFSAVSAKKTIRGSWWRGMYIRFASVIIIVIIFRLPAVQPFLGNLAYTTTIPQDSVLSWVGVILAAAGIAFAIWARVYLGRNWGMPMSLKENPELVTAGPYKYVRHPIYSGMLLAMFGSVLVGGLWWLIVLAASSAYFIFSATKEEKIMTDQFPNEYPAYRKRTKMLVPFVY